MKNWFHGIAASGLVLALFFFVSCNKKAGQKSDTNAGELQLSSTAFQGGVIPAKYACTGENISPPLQWQGAPKGAQRFALIVQDLDAPMGTFTHWMLWNIPANSSSLPESMPHNAQLPNGASQGINDFRKIGYGGPCPPAGETHHYQFALYALDVALTLDPGIGIGELEKAMRGHTLARAELRAAFLR